MSGKVTAIILHYNAPYEMLDRCVRSVLSQTYRSLEVVVADNGTDGVPERLQQALPQIRVLRFKKNLGFAAGNNRAIREVEGDYVLILNNDTVCAGNAVEEMVRVMESNPRAVGAAPKMLFADAGSVIDAIGNLIDCRGSAFNMGIGQLDVGQYDVTERVLGCCFGAALLRRGAFARDAVGPLDESYFMYYEDVDWCIRANLLGHIFLTAPAAVVRHAHSFSTKSLPYAWKYWLIQRNLLRTVMKDFEAANAIKTILHRCRNHAFNVLLGPYRWANVRILLGAPLDAISYFTLKRRRIQRKRTVGDEDLFRLAADERPYFDPVRYTPQRTLANLRAMYERLSRVSGNPRHLRIARALGDLSNGAHLLEREQLRERLRTILSGEPAEVLEFVV